MSEQTQKLQGLYTQLEAELPEHIKTHVTLGADENKGCINIVIKDMGEMGKENFKQLRCLLEENYSADFINPAFPHQPYYAVQPKPVVALPSKDSIEKALRDSLIKKAHELNLGIPDANLLTMPLSKLETLVKVASKVAPETEQTKTPGDAKPVEAPKQPSPISLFTRDFCSVCEDNQKCDVSAEGGRFHRATCLQLLDLQYMQTLNANLEKLCKVPVSQPAKASDPAAVAPPIQKVERNTRPTEGHLDGGIVWIYAENKQGERYEKALEKDNQRSNDYFELRGQIDERIKAGKKGLELNGKWLWLSDRDDYIGRKVAKQFPKGDRR